MLNSIIAFSIRNKLIVGLWVIALIGYGCYEVTKLPIDAVPDITNNQVQIITQAPSFGATDIERLITYPIEQANSNIPGLKEIRSFSRFGLSLVTIVFNDETDVYWARQQVAERLQQVQNQIPQGIGMPELAPVTTGLGEIYQYVVKPSKGYERKYDAIALRTIQDYIVRRQLIGVKGVAEVSSFGGKLKQYEVAINPDKLKSHGVTIQDVFSALENNNQNTGGAYIEKKHTVLFIRSEGLINNIDDIKNIAIVRPNSSLPLYIRDIADVNIGYATRYGAMCYNDQGEVAGAVVMMLKGANSNEVIDNIKARIEQIKHTLPEGVEIEPFLDRTKMVNNAIGTVEKNLLEGALIVIFVLVLFLGNFRAGLLVASVIPLAMLFAICMMNLFGVSGNLMSLGALDFGLIIDGAVIIVEAVLHSMPHIRGHDTSLNKQINLDHQVQTTASKMMNSAVFGQIIILVVYLPIFTLQGIEGKMFKPMAQTVSFALLGAFILSLTYIPMMSALVLRNNNHGKENISDKIMGKVTQYYQRWLIQSIQYSKRIIFAVFVLFILTLGLLFSMGGEFIPALEEGDFAVDTRVLTGSNLNTSIEYTQKAAHVLLSKFPEVEKVVTKIGSGEVPTDPMPMEASDMMVILKDKSEWSNAESFDELAEKMGKELEAIPGITTGFQYPVQMRFNELMTGARQDVVCKIFGENLDTLSRYADQLGTIIHTVKGAENIYIEPVVGMPQIIITYNRPMIAQYNLSIAEVNRVINTAFAGQSTGLIYEGEKRFDLVVRLDKSLKKNIDDIRSVLIPTPNGDQIPLYQVARVEISDGPNQIQREDAKRRIIVGFNVRGRDVQSIVGELQKKVGQKIKFPPGYYVTYGGAFENLEQAKSRLMIAVPVSLLLIFLLLYFAFDSLKQSLLIYTAIPLSTIGGILFLTLRGMPFSISAGIGFIALFGVAVLNGIVLIAEFNQLKNQKKYSLARIVYRGTSNRLRPVLMTAFVASFGFLPMALSNGAGAEVQRPLATVVIGGLLIATFLTLFVLPILYILFEKGISQKSKRKMKLTPIVLLSFLSLSMMAQNPLTLENAYKMALENNKQLKNEKLKSEFSKALMGTSSNISKANIGGEFGQLNTYLFDTKFGINQTFDFPTVYRNQKQLYTEEWKAALLTVSLQEHELKKEITRIYYQYNYLKQKELLLQKADSLFSHFYEKAALRMSKGESNILEKTTAENQKAGISIQLEQLKSEIRILLLEFQFLLNSEMKYVPTISDNHIIHHFRADTAYLSHHPSIQLLQQYSAIAKSNTVLERSKLLPNITLGYNNTSFNGLDPNGSYNTMSNRFHSGNIGLGIPVFSKSQRNRIKAGRLNETIALNNENIERQKLNTQFEKLNSLLSQQSQTIQYYKDIGLKNAAVISNTARLQFISGEINYLDYAMLLHQAIDIESKYIDANRQIHETEIELYFLTIKQ